MPGQANADGLIKTRANFDDIEKTTAYEK